MYIAVLQVLSVIKLSANRKQLLIMSIYYHKFNEPKPIKRCWFYKKILHRKNQVPLKGNLFCQFLWIVLFWFIFDGAVISICKYFILNCQKLEKFVLYFFNQVKVKFCIVIVINFVSCIKTDWRYPSTGHRSKGNRGCWTSKLTFYFNPQIVTYLCCLYYA